MNIMNVTMTGNVVAAPEKGISSSGTSFCNFRVASDRSWKEGDTWHTSDTIFIEVRCWGVLAENAVRSLRKGSAIIVLGRLVMNEWEVKEGDDTKKRITYRIKATHVGPDLMRGAVIPVEKEQNPGKDSSESSSKTSQKFAPVKDENGTTYVPDDADTFTVKTA